MTRVFMARARYTRGRSNVNASPPFFDVIRSHGVSVACPNPKILSNIEQINRTARDTL
jgi:hypothetical protein